MEIFFLMKWIFKNPANPLKNKDFINFQKIVLVC